MVTKKPVKKTAPESSKILEEIIKSKPVKEYEAVFPTINIKNKKSMDINYFAVKKKFKNFIQGDKKEKKNYKINVWFNTIWLEYCKVWNYYFNKGV